jgi:hypothetical protein
LWDLLSISLLRFLINVPADVVFKNERRAV